MAPAASGTEHKHSGSSQLTSFPGEHPPQHAAREWLEKTRDTLNRLDLAPVLADELPTRVRHLRNYPDELTTVPDDVAAAC